MQDLFNLVIAFILENWQILLPIILSVVEFIILLVFRKTFKVKNLTYTDNFMTDKLVILIRNAEEKFGSGHGREKLRYVLDEYLSGMPYWERFPHEIFLEPLIEDILSTPQKKGVIYGQKDAKE